MSNPTNPTPGKSDANDRAGASRDAGTARDAGAVGQPGGPHPGDGAVAGKIGNAPPAPRTLSLVKGPHRFRFNYEAGEEPAVLDALVEMVHRRELPFDWFDAAVLSHQLGQHLAKELMGYLPKKAA